MTLDVSEQVRERPSPLKLVQPVAEKRPVLRSEMKKGDQVDADKKSSGWKVMESESCGLEDLFSRVSLDGVSTTASTSREEAMRRLLGVAEHGDIEALRSATLKKSTTEMVEVLKRILDKRNVIDKKEKKTEPKTDDTKLTKKSEAKPVKILMKQIEDDNDLCPRSPMRVQQHPRNNFPYQNTSRRLHSGGCVSTYTPPAAVPQHQSNVDLNFMTSPMVMMGLPDNLHATINGPLTDEDQQLLLNLVENIMGSNPKQEETNDLDSMIPTPIQELNQGRNIFRSLDHQVPLRSPIDRNSMDDSVSTTGWGDPVDFSDESTSGCYSLSPTSILSSSPGGGNHLPLSPDSGHVVPDISGGFVPNMSPSGHFFDDNAHYASYNLEVNVSATKDGRQYEDACRVSPSSYGTPSPTFNRPGNVFEDIHEDFEVKVRIASDDMLCSSHEVLDSADPLLDLRTETDTFIKELVGPPNAGASPFASDLPQNGYHFGDHSPTANFNILPDLNQNVTYAEQASFCGQLGDAASCPPLQVMPNFTVAGASYVGSTPAVVNTSNVHIGIIVPVTKRTSPSLKEIKPKLGHSSRPEKGKERLLQMMDKEKKDQAWAKVSQHLTDMAKKDADGDTQLMILCANSNGNESSILEYTYALVENLKRIPNALSTVNNQNQSVLHLAAMYSQHKEKAVIVRYIADTLLELGENINYIGENGNSMLHELCQYGDDRHDIFVELLSLRDKDNRCYFDVNLENREGKTPLHVAVTTHAIGGVSCLKIVRLLVAEGADPMKVQKKGHNTALHLAISHSCLPNLVEAVLSGPTSKSELVNTINLYKDSPLHVAAARNDVHVKHQMQVINILLKHGAVKSYNAAGKFPIALVADERRQEIKQVYESRRGSLGSTAPM